MKKTNFMMKNTLLAGLIVTVVLITGVSYAFYAIAISGSSNIGNNTAANFHFTSTLSSSSSILNPRLSLIAGNTYTTNANSVAFSVTNENDSTLPAGYIIKITDLTMTKNLSSAYFKWAIVITGENPQTITGNFLDTSIGVEGNTDRTTVNVGTKELMSVPIVLGINKTDNITYYMWLENDTNVAQVYLTSGSFSGKLAVEAVPIKVASQ